MEAKNIISKNADFNGWHPNTDLDCELKTLLRSDKRMETGKDYRGVFRLDSDAVIDAFLCRDTHYTFVETLPTSTKRNPCVFSGKYITITRRDDGSYRPNFKPLKMDRGFTVDGYAVGVMGELRHALTGLIENR